MKKNFKIIDCYATKTHHEVFNLSLILISSQIANKVICKMGSSAYNNIINLKRKYQDLPSNVKIVKKGVYEKDSKTGAFIRTFMGFFITLFEYLMLSPHQILIFTTTNPFSFPLITSLNILLRKKIIFTMHGELELQYNHPKFGHLAWLYRWMYTINFKYLLKYSPKTQLLVLGESIKNNLCSIFPYLNKNIISIYHPILIDINKKQCSNKLTTPLIIGTVGVMKKEKGFDNLIELSNDLKKEILSNKLVIRSIGKVENIDTSPHTLINWIGKDKTIPRTDFDKYINELNFILFLYPTNSYKLTASGAITDAIRLHIPILSLKNDFFCDLIGNNSIGYLKDTIEELANTIRTIITTKETIDYNENFSKLINKTSIPNIAKLLNTSLQEKHFI